MRNRLWTMTLLAWLGLLFAGGPAEAREKAIPKTPEGFTKYMADRFAEALPGNNIGIKGPLDIEVDLPKGPHEVYLNRIWDFCERDREHCREEVNSFLASMPATIAETADNTIRPADIRAVVRPEGYVAQLRKIAAGHPGHEGVFRPIAGDIWMICVADRPHGIETLTHADIGKLGLSEDQVIALALKNLATNLRPLKDETHAMNKTDFKVAAGDFYDSSRMLLHDSWARMSEEMHGHLVVAVPNTDVLMYGNGTEKGDRHIVSGYAQAVAERGDKPISTELFQWTPTGWEVVKTE